MTDFKHPEEAMRARMLGHPVVCASCAHMDFLLTEKWCKNRKYAPLPKAACSEQTCSSYKLTKKEIDLSDWTKEEPPSQRWIHPRARV